jgi:hypothetical protein
MTKECNRQESRQLDRDMFIALRGTRPITAIGSKTDAARTPIYHARPETESMVLGQHIRIVK